MVNRSIDPRLNNPRHKFRVVVSKEKKKNLGSNRLATTWLAGWPELQMEPRYGY